MIKSIAHDELAGSTDAVQMPNVPYSWGYIKAAKSNTGNVYVGSSSDVSILGTTDAAAMTGFELEPSAVMVVDNLGNLNNLWYISENAGDDLMYFVIVTQ